MKIEIKNQKTGEVIFVHECENNTIKKTVEAAVELKISLRYADLRDAGLRGTGLQYADLRGANLQGTGLQYADLRGANIDFACLYLSCKSLNFKSDEKQRIQIAFHWASLVSNSDNQTDVEEALLQLMKHYVNKFHRTDVEKL